MKKGKKSKENQEPEDSKEEIIKNEPTKDKKEEADPANIQQEAPLHPSVFLSGDLIGIQVGFILMIVLPITTFYITRFVLDKLKFSKAQQDMISAVYAVSMIWAILIFYAVYYYYEDMKFMWKKQSNAPTKTDKKEKTD